MHAHVYARTQSIRPGTAQQKAPIYLPFSSRERRHRIPKSSGVHLLFGSSILRSSHRLASALQWETL